jgi:hypothetical protein
MRPSTPTKSNTSDWMTSPPSFNAKRSKYSTTPPWAPSLRISNFFSIVDHPSPPNCVILSSWPRRPQVRASSPHFPLTPPNPKGTCSISSSQS